MTSTVQEDEAHGHSEQSGVMHEMALQQALGQRPVAVDDVRVHFDVAVVADLVEDFHDLE